MTINWITVSAQVLNFLVLVWILKRLLYQPVLRAMEGREQRVHQQLEQAVARERAAAAAAQEHQAARQSLDHERDEILAQAGAAAEAERRRLLGSARTDVAELRERWQKQVEAERGEFLKRLERQILLAVSSIARRALADLSDETLEARMLAVFQAQLAHLDPDAGARLRSAGGPAEVRTSFDADAAQQKSLTEAVQQVLGADVVVHFRRSADLISGIELAVGGQKLGWCVGDYLDDLNEHIDALLSHPAFPQQEVQRAS